MPQRTSLKSPNGGDGAESNPKPSAISTVRRPLGRQAAHGTVTPHQVASQGCPLRACLQRPHKLQDAQISLPGRRSVLRLEWVRRAVRLGRSHIGLPRCDAQPCPLRCGSHFHTATEDTEPLVAERYFHRKSYSPNSFRSASCLRGSGLGCCARSRLALRRKYLAMDPPICRNPLSNDGIKPPNRYTARLTGSRRSYSFLTTA